jgi:hypothetical protein
MILTAAIGWLAQTVLQRSAMYSFMQTVEEARHVGLDKKDLLMEAPSPKRLTKSANGSMAKSAWQDRYLQLLTS